MPDRIKLLPEIVANQIKAGEVVNSPSSVVKEMMENAIDAGASSVTVNFRNGGRDLVQIIDNGCGMSANDARMAFDRQATSKISSADDIYALHTFGFRGEALASIAAVAQVELLTRQVEEETGTLTTVNGGEFISQTPIATPVGSQFRVSNLFYNTPARRKFIDNNDSRLVSQIKGEFKKIALCNPQVRFELRSNDAPLYNLAPANLATRIVDVTMVSMRQNLLAVDVDTSIARIEGFVGKPVEAHRNKNDNQYLFVNGRYFRSPYLNKAILKAYEKLIPDGCFPAYFIYITVAPERLDVNVHPQKTEVKFADREAVWQILNAAVRETLAKTGAVPLMDFDSDGSIDIPVAQKGAVYAEPKSTTRADYNPFSDEYLQGDGTPKTAGNIAHSHSAAYSSHDTFSPDASFLAGTGITDDDFEQVESAAFATSASDDEFEEILSAVGNNAEQQNLELQHSDTCNFEDTIYTGGEYAVARYGARTTVVSLSRARERVLYDNYRSLLTSGNAVCQQLLFPERIMLSPDEYSLAEERAVELAALGFDMEFAGAGTVMLNGIPADADIATVDKLLYDLLQTLSLPLSVEEQRLDRIATVMAQSGSHRTTKYSREEACALLDQLTESTEHSYTPSGKQIFAELTDADFATKLR